MQVLPESVAPTATLPDTLKFNAVYADKNMRVLYISASLWVSRDKPRMAEFIFRLETALHVRERLEQEAEIKFSQIQGRLLKATEKLGDLQTRLYRTTEELQREAQETTGLVLRTYNDYLQALRQTLTKQQAIVARLEEERQQRWAILVERRREREVLAKLREEQYQGFLSEQRKQQDKQLDEVATMLDMRQNRQGSAEYSERKAA